jgi:HEAT repeat protein
MRPQYVHAGQLPFVHVVAAVAIILLPFPIEANEALLSTLVAPDGWSRALDLRTEISVPVLADALGDSAVEVRRMAAKRLSMLGPGVREAASELRHSLEHEPDEDARRHCAKAFLQLSDDLGGFLPAMELALRDSSGNILNTAIRGYVQLGDAGFQALAEIVRRECGEVRRRGLWAMCAVAKHHGPTDVCPDRETRKVVFSLLSDPETDEYIDIGAKLLQGLRLDPERAIPLLRKKLVESARNDGFQIVRALQAYGIAPDGRRPDGFEPMKSMGSTEEDQYRLWAESGALPGGTEWQEDLRSRLREEFTSDDEEVVREALRKARLLGPAAAPLIPELAASLEKDIGDPAVHILFHLGSPCLRWVCPLLTADDWAAVIRALNVCWHMGPTASECISGILDALQSSHRAVRFHALRTLVSVDSSRARDVVPKTAIGDEFPSVRVKALKMLPDLLSADAGVPIVAEALDDEDKLVRRAAVEAAGRYGSDAASLVSKLVEGFREAPDFPEYVPTFGAIGDTALPAIPLLVEHFVRAIQLEEDARLEGRRPICGMSKPPSRKAGEALLAIDPSSAVPGILRLLKSDVPAMRSIGAVLCRDWEGIPSTVRTALIEATFRTEWKNRGNFHDALLRMRPLDSETLAILLKSYSESENGLLKLGSRVANLGRQEDGIVSLLIEGLQSDSASVRHHCFEALAYFEDSASYAVPYLDRIVREAPKQKRDVYLRILNRLDPPYDYHQEQKRKVLERDPSASE